MNIEAALRDAAPEIVRIVLIVLGAVIAIRVADRATERVFRFIVSRRVEHDMTDPVSAAEVRQRLKTIDGFLRWVVRAFIVLIAILTVLIELRIDLGPTIAGLGVLGIALGLWSQTIVRDYFNGLLILLENQFSVGDVVRIAGVSGAVEEFSLRRTILRDLDGIVHVVPNGEIKVASNLTRTWARINLDVTVAYGSDIERVKGIVDEVGRTMASDPNWTDRLLESPRTERVEALGEYGVTLKILGQVRPADRWAASGELRLRLLRAFEQHGIVMPVRLQMTGREGLGGSTAGSSDSDA